MYFFMNLCTIFGPKSFFSKALIIRLFLVYLFICSNKNSTTQLFILIRFKSNNNLLRKYQSRFLEPTYWLRALVTLLTTCKPRQTKILLHSVFRQKQISSQIVPTTTMTYKTEKPQTICNRPHSTILKLHFTSKTCIQSEGPFMYYVSKFSDFFDPPPSPLPFESINVRLKRSRICHFLTTLPTPINDYVIHGWTLTTSAELPQ